MKVLEESSLSLIRQILQQSDIKWPCLYQTKYMQTNLQNKSHAKQNRTRKMQIHATIVKKINNIKQATI